MRWQKPWIVWIAARSNPASAAPSAVRAASSITQPGPVASAGRGPAESNRASSARMRVRSSAVAFSVNVTSKI